MALLEERFSVRNFTKASFVKWRLQPPFLFFLGYTLLGFSACSKEPKLKRLQKAK